MIKWLTRLLKPRIEYVDSLPEGFAGKFYGYPFFPVIKILKKYENDTGLFEHELTHYKQYLKTFMLWELLYFIDYFRLKFEVEAYKRQLQFVKASEYDQTVDIFSELLCMKYDLPITFSQARALLLH